MDGFSEMLVTCDMFLAGQVRLCTLTLTAALVSEVWHKQSAFCTETGIRVAVLGSLNSSVDWELCVFICHLCLGFFS